MDVIDIHVDDQEVGDAIATQLLATCMEMQLAHLVINIVKSRAVEHRGGHQRKVAFFRCFSPDMNALREMKARIHQVRGVHMLAMDMEAQYVLSIEA